MEKWREGEVERWKLQQSGDVILLLPEDGGAAAAEPERIMGRIPVCHHGATTINK